MTALSMILQLPALSSAASLLGSLASLAAQPPRHAFAVVVISLSVWVGVKIRDGIWWVDERLRRGRDGRGR